MDFVSFLYKLARGANDARAIAEPKRAPKRVRNKVIGRVLARKGVWNRLWK